MEERGTERWKGRDGEDDEDNESVKWKRQTCRERDRRIEPTCSVFSGSVGVSHMLVRLFTDWLHQEL